MKKMIATLAVIAVISPSVTFAQEATQRTETRGEQQTKQVEARAENPSEKRSNRCERIGARIDTQKTRLRGVQTRYEKGYENMSAKINRVIEFIGDRYDTSMLLAFESELDALKNLFIQQSQQNVSLLTQLEDEYCKGQFDRDLIIGLKESLRESLAESKSIASDIKILISESVKPELQDIRTSLQEA
jgi:hypothetical protein